MGVEGGVRKAWADWAARRDDRAVDRMVDLMVDCFLWFYE